MVPTQVVRKRIDELEERVRVLTEENISGTPPPPPPAPPRTPSLDAKYGNDNTAKLHSIISELNLKCGVLSEENLHLQTQCSKLMSSRPTGTHDTVMSLNYAASELEDLRMQVTCESVSFRHFDVAAVM